MNRLLEENAEHYDLDGDGSITDADIERAERIQKNEDAARKHMAQLRLARASLNGLGVYTVLLFMPFVPDSRIEQITKISDLFYISLCSVVCAYMGFSSYMSRK